MKPIRLVLIPALTSQPAPYMVVAADGGVLARGVLTPDVTELPEPMRTVAVCPGSGVTIHWLDLPAGSAAQVRAAAAWRLRDDLAAAPDRLVTIVGPPAGPGEGRLTAVVGRNLLEAWIDYLDALGVRADVLLPDMMTVPEPDGDGVLHAVTFGESVALRGRRFAASVQPDIVDLIAGERQVVVFDDARAVEQALSMAARSPALNLLDGGDRERGAARIGWRRAAGLAAAVVLSPLLLSAAGAVRDDMAARRLEAETLSVIARAAPDLAGSPDPVAAVRRRAAAAPPPGGTAAAAAALFGAVEAVEGAELDTLVVSPEEGLKATVSHQAYSDMETVTRRMADAGLTVVPTATLDDNGRVVSDITIGARP